MELCFRKLFLAARKLLLAASRDGNRKVRKGSGHRPREYELWVTTLEEEIPTI